jgi:hypothetical protein
MSRTYEKIDDALHQWVSAQKVFFVATAPIAGDGLVNCSPKGMDAFRVLGPREVGYLDLTGSGAETISHLRENGRIVIMMCAFDGAPNILRLHGTGQVFERGGGDYARLAPRFPDIPGARAIIHVAVSRISDSCGYAVPRYDYRGDRDTLVEWAERKGEDGLRAYREKNNRHSLDGLPGMRAP